MLTLRLIVVIVHISFAALILGVPLGLPRLLRDAISSSHDSTIRLAAAEALRRGKLAQIASLVTLLTGVWLILLSGGFAVISTNFHIALGIMLVAIAIGLFVQKPAMVAIAKAANAEPANTQGMLALLPRVAIGSGALQLLWLIILVLMLYRF